MVVSTGSTTLKDRDGNTILTVRSYCGDLTKKSAAGTLGRLYVDPTFDNITAARGAEYTGPYTEEELPGILKAVLYSNMNNSKKLQEDIWNVLNRGEKLNPASLKEVPDTFHWAIVEPPETKMQPQIIAMVTKPADESGGEKARITKILSPDGRFRNYTVTPEKQPKEIEISKQNLGRQELAGAKMKVLRKKDGAEVDSWTSEASGTHLFKCWMGDYILHEEAAPAGYKLAADIPFTVAEDGTVKVNDVEVTAQSADGKTLLVMTDEVKPGGGGETPKPPKETPEEPPKETPEEPPKTPEEPPGDTPKPPEDRPKTPKPNPGTPPKSDEPEYHEGNTPDPNRPDSPDEFTLIGDDGTPLAKYKKVMRPDGSFIYVSDEGVPLGEVPKTQDAHNITTWYMIMLISGLAAVWQALRKDMN